jgi:hypothetical protein
MKMSRYEISYQPFHRKLLGAAGTQKISVVLNEENLAGFLLMASKIIHSSQIEIKGIPIDVDPYLGEGNFKYSAIFLNLVVQFNTLDGFQGAIFICNLLGKSWEDFILDIKFNNISIGITSRNYFGRIVLYQKGNMIDIRELPQYNVNLMTTDSLIRNSLECFDLYSGFYLPSNIYFSSADIFHRDIIASAAITQNNFMLPRQYRNGLYIYNVCTYSPYRRQGIMKSILIMMINDILKSDMNANIYLEVEHHTGAYELYTSLGFYKVDEINEPGKSYHLMKFL